MPSLPWDFVTPSNLSEPLSSSPATTATSRSTLTGMAAAELASGQTSNLTKHFLQEPAPKKLPPKPFSTIGANIFLRYKEHKATAE